MPKQSPSTPPQKVRLSTGIDGLDDVLQGGFIENRGYLVRGGPGTGKTTLGLHFLAAASPEQKQVLITLGEQASQILEGGTRLGLNLETVHSLDFSPDSSFFTKQESYDLFSPAEVDRDPIAQKIIDTVRELKPDRIFVDSMTQFRYLAPDAFQFRKQVLSFLRFMLEQGATVLFTSESSPEIPDNDLQFMCDGVITLELTSARRILSVTKFRHSAFQSGLHSMKLDRHGISVFPKLLPEAYRRDFKPEPIPSGIPTLDRMLHGGLERGMVTLFSGPSGVGKTTIGLQFMKEAASRQERSVIYTFEEEIQVILKRSENISIPARAMIEQGSLVIEKIEPLQYTPDEFASIVRHEVEERNTQIVMIDSVSGYGLSIQGENFLRQLHALCKYLANMGVTVLLISETGALSGSSSQATTEGGFTYLADNLILMRYIDQHENDRVQIRKGISVLKKRLSDFEKTMREFKITRYGLEVGPPMTGLQGILSGELRQEADEDD